MGERMMIAVDAAELAAIRQELSALRRSIEAVQMAPRPEWLGVDDYATLVGRTTKTVRAWVREGRLDTKREGSVLMIRRP